MDQERITRHKHKEIWFFFNKLGIYSIEKWTHDKKRDQQHQDEVTVKSEKYQEEVALGSKRKRVGSTQLKIQSKLTYQDR